jgi:chromosome partitioning protein
MAYVICVNLTKGGVGKTTTAVALGEAAMLGGGPVTVIDADRMGGALRWSQLAAAAGREMRAKVIGMPVEDIPRRIHPVAREANLIVIDAPPPGSEKITEAAFEVSDLIVMPVPPRLAEVDRVLATIEVAQRHGKPARAVLIDVSTRAGLADQREKTLEALRGWGVTVYKTEFPSSVAVERAYGTYLRPSSPMLRFGMELMTEILTSEIQGKGRNDG